MNPFVGFTYRCFIAPRRTEYAGDTEGVKIKYGLAQQVIKNVYEDLDIEYHGTDNNDYRGG